MKIALVTDAWKPQVNGVVRTWGQVVREWEGMGHEVRVIHPGLFRTVGVPKYPEIRLSILPGRVLWKTLDEFQPEAIHIATEGTLGLAGRGYCRRNRLAFTTSYHTQYPHYMKIYYGVPQWLTYGFLRWFHGGAERTLVPAKSVGKELGGHGFKNIVVWNRGVDTQVFRPWGKEGLDLPRPIFLTAGRVAAEKNIEAFLKLDLPGSKVVVGDGPVKKELEKKYPKVHWTGYLFGEELARNYAAADVFVFASRTDTYGVTMLEANACGLPVAAYPVTGPIDVVKQGVTGVLDEDLRKACLGALELKGEACVTHARENTWERCARTVIENLAVVDLPSRKQAVAARAGWFGLGRRKLKTT